MFIGQQKVPRVSLEKARPTTAELAEAARTQRKHNGSKVSSHGRLDEEGEDGAPPPRVLSGHTACLTRY